MHLVVGPKLSKELKNGVEIFVGQAVMDQNKPSIIICENCATWHSLSLFYQVLHNRK